MARERSCWPPSQAARFSLLVTAFIGFGDVEAQVAPVPVHANSVAGDGALGQRWASAAPKTAIPKEISSTGNPLWEIPVGVLTETSARAIFSPSRRPPAPPALATSYVRPPKPPTPKEPDRPQLALLGTVIGDSQAMAVFLDKLSTNVIRLRIGESHGGWTLLSVRRDVTSFEKDHIAATFMLPRPNGEQPDRSVANDVAATNR